MQPRFVPDLVALLRRRGIPLGVDDVAALRTSLAAGFGWESRAGLCELCVSLWAKSPSEAEVVRAAFAAVAVPDWNVTQALRPGSQNAPDAPDAPSSVPPGASPVTGAGSGTPATLPQPRSSVGVAPPPHSGLDDPTLILVPQYPVTPRAVAQVWRRMRQPARRGPAVELDVEETVRRQARTGVVTPPVLVPARRNVARLLLLVDIGGSMLPYEDFVAHVELSIRRAARLDVLAVRYFHDVPGHADRAVLAGADARHANLDRILADISPLAGGRVYREPELTRGETLSAVVEGVGRSAAVCVVSDAGAARGRLDLIRLLDTVAMLKALRGPGRTTAWLNPVDPRRWARTTAALVARHVPMHPLTVSGMYAAVDVLRGRFTPVARPL
ncbi:VWA domain-containing protein [Micromonospora sp. NPDC049060]|uniref:VWA domain-containing protein n=1 Tax=Micromonospora sp. NPDC049060 TaxID=3154828 RepID=UPI0033DADAC6